MIHILITLLLSLTLVSADFFNFFNQGQQQQHQPDGRLDTPQEFEEASLNTRCERYLCTDTGICVDGPQHCPCPYPSSQLRCVLPKGKFICISKPAGEISSKYDDSASNWKVDAGDDNVRDCGWVKRAYKGLV